MDVNPSMIIDFESGSFYCFGCLASGDAMKFVMLAESDKDDFWSVKKYFRIIASNKTGKNKIKHINYFNSKVKVDYQQLYDEAHDFYFGLKTIDWKKEKSPEKAYMLKRGFNAEALNLCGAKLTLDENYPIVFPMLDNGNFKGWVCRTTSPAIEAKRKYLYNKGFKRSDTIVGSYERDKLVLVEGYMDWLKMKQFGVNNAGAILGWKITNEQVAKLKEKNIRTVISALDADECGRKGTEYLKKFFNVIEFQYQRGVKDLGEMNQDQFRESRAKTKKLSRR